MCSVFTTSPMRLGKDYLLSEMRTGTDKHEWTPETLMGLPRDGKKYEVLGGKLLVSPTGFHHGFVSSRLATALLAFALKHRLGLVVDSSTGFRLKNGDCLSPDVSFVRKERLRAGITRSFFPGAPDLAVEVLSPRESKTSLLRKLTAYFANGTRLVWVVDLKKRVAHVHHSPKRSMVLRGGDSLEGEDVLPGFTLPLADLFELPDFGAGSH